jgi:hypothetical protein
MTIPIHNEHTSCEEDNKAAILFAARGYFALKGIFAANMLYTQKATRTSPGVIHQPEVLQGS